MISSNRSQIGTSFNYTITPHSAFFFEELDHCTNFQSLACGAIDPTQLLLISLLFSQPF